MSLDSYPAILALDIGTSSTRAIVYHADTGEAMPGTTFSDEHEPDATQEGASILNPEALLKEVVDCAAKSLDAAPNADILAVACCTFWHSTLGVDSAGEAVTPILLWSDRRSAGQVAQLREKLDADAYTERTGCPLHTSYLPGRLLWLQQTRPDEFQQCARFLSPGEYIYGKLFGADKIHQSYSMASATGLWDAHDDTWDAETLACIPGLTASHFAPVTDEPVNELQSPYLDKLPRLAKVRWYPALGDGACSNLGVGGVSAGRIALMIGTSGAVRVAVPGTKPPPVPKGLWRYRADKSRFLVGGALSNGGSVWAWLTDTLHLPPSNSETLNDAVGALPPDRHGLTVLPFLAGERAPLWRDDMTATITGMTLATTPLQITRAALEAVAYRFAAIRDELRAIAPHAEIIGTGGGLMHSHAWAQIIADVLGESITLSAEPEGSSRGAALWVRERLGRGKLEDAPFAFGTHFTPNPEYADIYTQARKRHEALLARLT